MQLQNALPNFVDFELIGHGAHLVTSLDLNVPAGHTVSGKYFFIFYFWLLLIGYVWYIGDLRDMTNKTNENLPVQVCFSSSGSKPTLHLHPPVNIVHLPSPLHRYVGGSVASAFWTHNPVCFSIIVISLPVGVSLKCAKFSVTAGQVM